MSKIVIYRGDTINGTVNLRTLDACSPSEQNSFPLPGGTLIEVHLPGSSGSVVLSTANVGEITVLDSASSKFSFHGDPAKSLLLALGKDQAITVVVTTPDTTVTTFEQTKVLTVLDRANP